MRAQVNGTNPTTIRIRAWADGGTEPTTWQYTATNAAAALQAPAASASAAYVGIGTTNAPVLVTFDDLSATASHRRAEHGSGRGHGHDRARQSRPPARP